MRGGGACTALGWSGETLHIRRPSLRGKRLVETMQLCYHRSGKRLPPCIQAEESDRPTKKVGVEAHDGGKRPGQSVRQTRRAKEQGASHDRAYERRGSILLL